MRTILALVALLVVAGCSDPQAGEPVWYGVVYDDNGCMVVLTEYSHSFDHGLVTLEECAELGEALVERFEADGYRCGRGCIQVGPQQACGAARVVDNLSCDATVEVIVP